MPLAPLFSRLLVFMPLFLVQVFPVAHFPGGLPPPFPPLCVLPLFFLLFSFPLVRSFAASLACLLLCLFWSVLYFVMRSGAGCRLAFRLIFVVAAFRLGLLPRGGAGSAGLRVLLVLRHTAPASWPFPLPLPTPLPRPPFPGSASDFGFRSLLSVAPTASFRFFLSVLFSRCCFCVARWQFVVSRPLSRGLSGLTSRHFCACPSSYYAYGARARGSSVALDFAFFLVFCAQTALVYWQVSPPLVGRLLVLHRLLRSRVGRFYAASARRLIAPLLRRISIVDSPAFVVRGFRSCFSLKNVPPFACVGALALLSNPGYFYFSLLAVLFFCLLSVELFSSRFHAVLALLFLPFFVHLLLCRFGFFSLHFRLVFA